MYNGGKFSDVEIEGGEVGNATRINHDYHDETWNQEHFTYDPKPQNFIGVFKSTFTSNQFPQ